MESHLSDITTVSDLLKVNQANTNIDSILESIWELKPAEARDIVDAVLSTMINWHHTMTEKESKNGDLPSAFAWNEDMVKLQQALNLISEIEL